MNISFQKTTTKDVSWNEELDLFERSQDIVRRVKDSQEHATITMKSEKPIGIVLASDWHIGSEGVDYKLFKKHMELVKEEPQAFMVTLSNTIDNMLFPSAMFEQIANPTLQRDFITKFIRQYIEQNKLLAIVGSRCHEGWSQQKADVDINRLMFLEAIQSYSVPYFPVGGVLEIVFNGFNYSLGLVHKARYHSSLNPTNANKKMAQMKWPVDITAIAHHHVKEVLQAYQYEGTNYQKVVTHVRTGTYKINDGYGEGEGFGQGHRGNPMVVIFPDAKRVLTFFDLEDGIKYLQGFR